MDAVPDFFLTSSEGYGLEGWRACRRIKRLEMAGRKGLALVEVDPPVPCEGLGLDRVLLAARFLGDDVNTIRHWPFFVYVLNLFRAEEPVGGRIAFEDVQIIAWAELYPIPRRNLEKTWRVP